MSESFEVKDVVVQHVPFSKHSHHLDSLTILFIVQKNDGSKEFYNNWNTKDC